MIIRACVIAIYVLLPLCAFAAPPERIKVAKDGRGFLLSDSGKRFTPWGFNYDRDFKLRLIEEYWDQEWETVEADFREMKALGANVVRVHLQYAKFMDAPDKSNEANVARLQRLVRFAEEVGLYLDLTGLGSYRKGDVPDWYNAMDEATRWAAQARFWETIASACADRPGVFCYNLMNEPVVPGEKRPQGQWLVPVELAGFSYVQHVTLDPAGRERTDVARNWTRQLVQAIRKHDRRALITVGMLPIDASNPNAHSGFEPRSIAPELDFLAVHVYPEKDKIEQAIATVKLFKVEGKPLVIEETFPLNDSAEKLGEFIERSREIADGWIGFYWGQGPQELKDSTTIVDQVTRAWLELFKKLDPNR